MKRLKEDLGWKRKGVGKNSKLELMHQKKEATGEGEVSSINLIIDTMLPWCVPWSQERVHHGTDIWKRGSGGHQALKIKVAGGLGGENGGSTDQTENLKPQGGKVYLGW